MEPRKNNIFVYSNSKSNSNGETVVSLFKFAVNERMPFRRIVKKGYFIDSKEYFIGDEKFISLN
jgi:hypothetical protein